MVTSLEVDRTEVDACRVTALLLVTDVVDAALVEATWLLATVEAVYNVIRISDKQTNKRTNGSNVLDAEAVEVEAACVAAVTVLEVVADTVEVDASDAVELEPVTAARDATLKREM